MFSIYQFLSYKEYFNQWLLLQPKKGHGEYRRLSLALNVSTTMVSQIFNGDKELSLELACEMIEYLHFNDDEAEYFLLMVEYSKAGSYKLKNRLGKQIKERQNRAKKLENRLKKEHVLDESNRQIYYSNWVYPALRILADVPEMNSAEAMSQRLGLPKNQIQKLLEFLLQNKIIVNQNGRFSIGPAHIYLPPDDPLASRDLQNWRNLAFQKMSFQNDKTFFYTGVYALSESVAEQIRSGLPDYIEDILKKVKPSPSETTRCLNLDFFEF